MVSLMSKIFSNELIDRQPIACRMLGNAISSNKLSHAYLLTGRNLQDKWLIAKFLACHKNCLSQSNETSCLTKSLLGLNSILDAPGLSPEKQQDLGRDLCQNCRWILCEQHPQAWLVLQKAQSSKTGKISVEEARKLALELSKTSDFQRTIVIPDANEEAFHRPSANALLKTIEEPGPNCLFLLFANNSEQVLPTIVSRCQPLPLISNSKDFDSSRESIFTATQTEPEDAGAILKKVGLPGKSLTEALNWSKAVLSYELETSDALELLDTFNSLVYSQLKEEASVNKNTSSFLKHLFQLTQASKQELEHFVQPKHALESFAISYQELHQKYRGENHIATR